MLRSVSHDLRSPLTAITTAAAGLSSQTLSPEARAELTSVIALESARLSRLVDNLLDLSKLQAGAVEPHADWCSVEELVRAALDSVPEPAGGFDVQIDPDLPLLRADATQLERALANVLDNASRYAADAPVTVRRVPRPTRSCCGSATADPASPARIWSVSSRPSTRPATAPAPGWAWQSRAGSWKPTEDRSGRSPCQVRARRSCSRCRCRPSGRPRRRPGSPSDARPGRRRRDPDPARLRVILRDAGFEVITAQTAEEALDPPPCARPTRRSSI